MIAQTLEQLILDQCRVLACEQQRQVLDFARALALAQGRGVAGKDLLRFAGSINSDDLEVMAQAIEESCEQVDHDEW